MPSRPPVERAMSSSPRRFAEDLLEKCQFYGIVGSDHYPVLLNVAEEVIRKAIAFELQWLANYLTERVKHEEARLGDDPPSSTAVTKPRGPRR